MMYILTYSLRNEEDNSKNFYKDTEIFTEKLITKGEALLGGYIDSYIKYQRDIRKVNTSRGEVLLELLILGVLWRVYSGDSQNLDSLQQGLLEKLSDLRSQNTQLKPGIDLVKGILSTLFLSPDLYDNLQISEPDQKNLEMLIAWLSATGEFTQEVNRLKVWQLFLETLPEKEAIKIISATIGFALWFEDRSTKALGKYTDNVDRYLNEIRPNKYWREDVIFCGRRRVEYHLNMVGAQIMNDSFREEFCNTQSKLLILPTCMRHLSEEKCKATKVNDWLKCTMCSADCPVYAIMAVTKDIHISVFMVPHESSISSGKNNTSAFNKDTGVIGVSCVLNLISGGWMLKSLGVPAQCVLLDYCGCKNHWHHEGFPTAININRLLELLE